MSGFDVHNKPLAAKGLISYRYPTRWGSWVMIGATDDQDAMNEARRSVRPSEVDIAKLERWSPDDDCYKNVSEFPTDKG